MPIHALVFLIGFLGLSIYSFVLAPAGVWVYIFEWYNHPPMHWWGKGFSHYFGGRWNLIAGLVMFTAVIIQYNKYKDIPVFEHKQSLMILLYTANALLVSTWAYSDRSFDVAIDHLKMLIVYWCIVKTHTDKRYIYLLLLLMIACCVNWGIDVTFNHAFKGRELKVGAPGLRGVNFVTAHAVAFLPFIAWFALTEKKWVRWLCIAGAPLVVNIFAHGRSRGAFLSMLVMLVVTILFSRRRMKLWALIGVVVGSVIVFSLMEENYFKRIDTLGTYEKDGSAMGRIDAWRVAWILVKKNPIGYGGESFDNGLAIPYFTSVFHTTHNMFFELLVAWGVQGTIFFFVYIFFVLKNSYNYYKYSWDGKEWPPNREAIIAFSLHCAVWSMLSASIFLNRYRWELWWIMGAVVIALQNGNRIADTQSKRKPR